MDKIRDLRIKEKFFMDDKYLNEYARLCGIYATCVYVSLCRHANKEQMCFPSKKLIGEELKISERTVFSAIKTLEKWNIIKIKKRGRKLSGHFKSNIYILIDKSNWKLKPQARLAYGNIEHTSQANNNNNHRNIVPNKDTNIKETKNDNENIKKIKEECNKIISKLKTKQ